MFSFKEIASVTLTLFAIIDILGSIPIIIQIRQREGKINSEKATLVAGALMIAFLFLGQSILSLFGVDFQSFALAGAIIIFLIGMEMILGVELFKHNPLAATGSIVPLAFPLIVGAGTMTTLLSLRAAYQLPNVLAGILFNLVFVYLVLKSSAWIERKLGKAGEDILRRVFGVILLAIAIKLFKSNF
ncbi:MarC family protein [Hymenobacter weizhouensis]|uniref:MarC family protein n=1 Tax=Hymenobacter sp. YIM 151500-1 TaxID=2987689 RepID=UPI002226EBF2|nr:MarC family protein [Hymenobacter sp. YIM 151500-1]UYZ65191.1 MarC family protein [Hymenobacter sp. YIM 151500-1]